MSRLLFLKPILKGQKAIWLLTSGCVLSVCAFAVVRSHSSQAKISLPPRQIDVAAAVNVERTRGPNQATPGVLLVSLLPTGFEPSEVTYPAGKILFGVNNRTGLSDLRFQLTDETGKALGEKRMVKERTWRRLIEPKPGRYELRVLGHPTWRCDVIITP